MSNLFENKPSCNPAIGGWDTSAVTTFVSKNISLKSCAFQSLTRNGKQDDRKVLYSLSDSNSCISFLTHHPFSTFALIHIDRVKCSMERLRLTKTCVVGQLLPTATLTLIQHNAQMVFLRWKRKQHLHAERQIDFVVTSEKVYLVSYIAIPITATGFFLSPYLCLFCFFIQIL